MRADPAGEAARLTGPGAEWGMLDAMAYFGVSPTAFQTAMQGFAGVAPLAWNAALSTAAEGHNQAMIAADQQTHQAPGEPDLGRRATNAGYVWSSLAENIYAYSTGVLYGHGGFVIDWSYDAEDYDGALRPDWRTRGDGMQDPAGHRTSLLNPAITEIGIAVTFETNGATSVGPMLVTQDLGRSQNYKPQFVGVAFADKDGDGFYDIGEGLAGVTVALRNGTTTYTTVSSSSGSWQSAVSPGTYTIAFSGGGLGSKITGRRHFPI